MLFIFWLAVEKFNKRLEIYTVKESSIVFPEKSAAYRTYALSD